MSNLRILYNNIADTSLTLTASAAASVSLAATNLLTDLKAEVYRSTATTIQVVLTWATLQTFNMAGLIFGNLTSTATQRSRVYTNTTDVVGTATPAGDSGVALACAYAPFGSWPWGVLPLGVNAFSYGGSVYARSYFSVCQGRKLVIDVVDTANALGYIEFSRVVTGAYWELDVNPAWNPSLGIDSNTKHERSEAGDLRTEVRPVNRTLKLSLDWIRSASDRSQLYDLLMGNGMTRPVFVSLFPEDADPRKEQQHQMWGKLQDTALSHPRYGTFAAPLQFEEM